MSFNKLNKLTFTLFFLFLLTSCGGGYSLVNAYVDQEWSSGEEIKNHIISGSGNTEIRNLAFQRCKMKGFDNFNISARGKDGEFTTYVYECVNNRKTKTVKPSDDNKGSVRMNLNKAKKQCSSLGFKNGTEKFGECVMQLSN